jgi:hypothetical protein
MNRRPPPIGTLIACLNLFREADGSVHITVFNATGAIIEYDALDNKGAYERPHDYVEDLIVEAAGNIAKRRAEMIPRKPQLRVVGKEDE